MLLVSKYTEGEGLGQVVHIKQMTPVGAFYTYRK